jgi:beta-galactosidase
LLFNRGTFIINATEAGQGINGELPDTYISVRGWGKGLIWINGFNLGWYSSCHLYDAMPAM